MAKRLVNLKISHVAGVDRPANKRKFLIVKAEVSKATIKEEDGKYCIYDGDKKIGTYSTREAAQAAMAAMKSEGPTMLTKEQISKIGDKDTQEAVVKQAEEMAELDKKLKERDEEILKLKAEPHVETDDEKLWKGVPPAIRNRFEALQKKNEETEKKAKDERDQREVEHWVRKVSDFRYIPQVVPEAFGKVMKNVAEKCPTEAAEVHRLFSLADEVIAKGDLFREIGRSGNSNAGDATDIVARVDAIAAEIEKRDKVDKGTAIQRVFADHPEWYGPYRRVSTIGVGRAE